MIISFIPFLFSPLSFVFRSGAAMRLFLSFSILSAISSVVAVNFLPPAVPLSVRTPYLNTWLHGGWNVLNSAGDYATQWPVFGNSGSITGWASFVRVDNVAYRVLGGSPIGVSGSSQSIQVRTLVDSPAGGVLMLPFPKSRLPRLRRKLSLDAVV